MTHTTSPPQPPPTLLAATGTAPGELAGAIMGQIRANGASFVQAIGAGAINQTVKAIAIARGYAAPGGQDLICTPAFQDIQIDGQARTSIRFKVEPRG